MPLVARSDASAVITGGRRERGKGLVARAIHYLGSRSERPFVPVNCGSIPDSLFEDELFGHERGAFTVRANAATDWLCRRTAARFFRRNRQPDAACAGGAAAGVAGPDGARPWIGEAAHSERSLRGWDQCRSHAAGGGRQVPGATRLCRLCVLQTTLPPLRERGNDVVLLANHFLLRYARRCQTRTPDIRRGRCAATARLARQT